jgi:ubiquinone/menaquinone biosynthesis C-methylase UbiE
MSPNPSQFHDRYTQQASWTRSLRNYLFNRCSQETAHRILDVGSGTGAIGCELEASSPATIYGLDINLEFLKFSQYHAPDIHYIVADAHELPFSKGQFDISFCHFLLLWVQKPEQVVKEMARVTRSGGYVLAIAEPDYGGRIDYPDELAILGQWQINGLRQQGANPVIGRRLGEIFTIAGLHEIEIGVLGGQWLTPPDPKDMMLEWQILQSDIKDYSVDQISNDDIERLRNLDTISWMTRCRTLFIPTFYGVGIVD